MDMDWYMVYSCSALQGALDNILRSKYNDDIFIPWIYYEIFGTDPAAYADKKPLEHFCWFDDHDSLHFIVCSDCTFFKVFISFPGQEEERVTLEYMIS